MDDALQRDRASVHFGLIEGKNCMNENPLNPVPESGPAVMETMAGNIALTPAAQQYLNQTGPWIRFFSILMFVVSGFMMLAGVLLVLMGFMGKLASPGPLQGAGPMSGGMGMVFLGPV